MPSASPKVTIVRQRPGCVETPWVRFLLGGHAGEAVDDPDRTLVESHSLILCDRLQLLTPEVLDRLRSTPGVGMSDHVAPRPWLTGTPTWTTRRAAVACEGLMWFDPMEPPADCEHCGVPWKRLPVDEFLAYRGLGAGRRARRVRRPHHARSRAMMDRAEPTEAENSLSEPPG